MNEYHIIEEVGRGKYSVVYKGRKRKTIEFVAVKCLDKCHQKRILNEVAILHSLDHPNVMKFQCWYKTNNHLWVIVEYCPAGSLYQLLSQDGKLPESTVQFFAQDILRAIIYVHSKGTLVCDLKPSNILIDGHSILKLSDFRVSQRFGSDEARKRYDLRAHQASPVYMAPELFMEDGIHSTASDLWAFGCVLYEMATGSPPFLAETFESLWEMIMCDPVRPVEGFSDEFNDLIAGLLCKDPSRRLSWNELRIHEWLLEELPEVSLPPQVEFDRFCLAHSGWRKEMQELFDFDIGDAPVLRAQKRREAAAAEIARRERERQIAAASLRDKGSFIRQAAPQKDSNKALRKSTMLNRLSTIVRANLDRRREEEAAEEEVDPYRVSVSVSQDISRAAAAQAASGFIDLLVDNRNMVMVFTDEAAQELQRVSDSPSTANNNLSEIHNLLSGTTPSEMGSESSLDRTFEDPENSHVSGGSSLSQVVSVGVRPSSSSSSTHSTSESLEEIPEEIIVPNDTPPSNRTASDSLFQRRTHHLITDSQNRNSNEIIEDIHSSGGKVFIESTPARPKTAPMPLAAALDSQDSSDLPPRPMSAFPWLESETYDGPVVDHVLFTQMDNVVRPIMLNPRIEKASPCTFDKRYLGFEPLDIPTIKFLGVNELEDFIGVVQHSIGGPSELPERINALSYLESLCADADLSNIFASSSIMTLLVRMLDRFKSASFKSRICTVIGLLVRRATYIKPQISASNIVGILCDQLRDKNLRLRARAMGCLGELVFYIATQQLDKNPEDDVWDVNSSQVQSILRCLKSSEDETVQMYAVKTIENIAALSPDYSNRFAMVEARTYLFSIAQSSKNEYLKLGALNALSRLSRQSRSFGEETFEKLCNRMYPWILREDSQKIQQSGLNMLNIALSRGLRSRIFASLFESNLNGDSSLLQCIASLLESSSSLIQAKALLCCGLLACHSHRVLLALCERYRIAQAVEKAFHSQDQHVIDCVHVLEQCFRQVAPDIAESAQRAMQSLLESGALSSGMNSPASLTNTFSTSAGAALSAFRIATVVFPVLAHLSTSSVPVLREVILQDRLINSLALTLSYLEPVSSSTALHDFRQTLLIVVESILQQPSIFETMNEDIFISLLPALSKLLGSADGDVRFLCLKILTDVVFRVLRDPVLYRSDEPEHVSTQHINTLIVHSIFPHCINVLQDEDPIPLYGSKFLSYVVESNPAFCSLIEQLGIVPIIFEFFSLDHKNNNLHNLRLIRMLIDAPNVDLFSFFDLGLTSKFRDTLQFAFERGVDAFFEPCLDIVNSSLYSASEAIREQPSLRDRILAVNEGFCDLILVFSMLLHYSSDSSVSEKAASTLQLAAQLYPKVCDQLARVEAIPPCSVRLLPDAVEGNGDPSLATHVGGPLAVFANVLWCPRIFSTTTQRRVLKVLWRIMSASPRLAVCVSSYPPLWRGVEYLAQGSMSNVVPAELSQLAAALVPMGRRSR